jgi:hypothetical protein
MDETTISKYDRTYAARNDDSLLTKTSTIQNVQSITGKTETFMVQTARHPDLGDFIFVQCIDENQGVTRLALPPKIAAAIAAQRDSLTGKRRSIASRRVAQERKDRGELPGFMRKKKSTGKG